MTISFVVAALVSAYPGSKEMVDQLLKCGDSMGSALPADTEASDTPKPV